ncbi:glycosyltransferase [Arthrobacter sp. R-11]|uniref:glycosyltransferase n=1 Tax=Arthrobacter sp. R-11 TaxID=3404053 RepID=UPI003CF4BFAB
MRTSEPRPSVLVAHPSADLYGSDRVLLETVDGLLRHGARVLVTVPAPGPLVAGLHARGVNVVYCPTPVLRKSFLSPAGALKLAAAAVRGSLAGVALLRGSRPDLVLANTITVPLWTVLARLSGIPVLTHVHEAESSAPRPLRAALALPLLLSRGIVTNSSFSADTLAASLPRLRGRATVVYNGVPGPDAVVPARGELDGGLDVVYLGRLSHRKGVDVAIDAVLRLRARGVRARLSLVGAVFPGNEAYEEQLREQVARADAAEFITFHGFQGEVWPFLAGADVAVVPSRLDEPFGNTAVEALLAARPVIASNTSGLREAAGGYGSVQFVEPGDAGALAEALSALRDGWPEYREHALADAQVARDRHSPEGYGDNMARQVAAAVGVRSGKR